MTGDFYLGRCEYRGNGWAKLEVLAEWDERQRWREIDREVRRSAFPNDGIAWSVESAIRAAVKDSVWTFATIDNPGYEAGAREKYQAVRVKPAIEILDLRTLGGNEAVRRAIVEVGLDLDHRPTTETWIRLSENTCVALHLTQQSAEVMRWKAMDLATLRRIPIRNFDARFRSERVNGRLFLPPDIDESLEIFREDWSPDLEYFERLLRRVRRAEPLFGDKPSNAEIEQIIRKLRDAQVLSFHAEENKLLSQRLQQFLPMLEENITQTRALVGCLMGFPSIKTELDIELDEIKTRITSELRDHLEPRIRAELEASLVEVSERKEHELAALEQAQTAIQQLREQISEFSAARAEARSLLASELQTIALLVRDAKTPELLAAVAARYAIRIRTPIEHSPPDQELDAPPWIHAVARMARSIDRSELAAILKQVATVFGVDGPAITILDVLARAGQVPVLFGTGVGEAIRAYAFSVAGGELYRHRVDPTTIALDDLWRHPGTREPTAIAHAWRAAEAHPERTILLMIDGLAVAPSEFWFDIWCDTVRSVQCPSNLIVITALSDGGVQDFRKPLNVFLAGVPLRIQSQEMSIGERLKLLLGRKDLEPAILRATGRCTVGRDEGIRFGVAIADREPPSMECLRRALSIHSVALHTYGDEMATNLVRDFSRSRGLTGSPESNGAGDELLTESVISLTKLLGVRA